MSDVQRPTPDAPFSHTVPLATLSRERPTEVAFEADEAALRAAARYLEVDAVDALALTATLEAEGRTGWRLAGRLRAKYRQTCVVTLDPLVQTLDVALEREFLPADEIPIPEDREHGADEPDGPDAIGPGNTIDLAGVALETLALDIDPYPRARNAAFGKKVYAAPGVEPLTDEAIRPFAKLEALKARLAGADEEAEVSAGSAHDPESAKRKRRDGDGGDG